MRNVVVFLSLLFLCVMLVGLSVNTGAAQIRLNEILADPASDWNGDLVVGSKTDEWVEIINLGLSSVDVSCYRLGDLSGGFDWRFAFAGVLGPGDVSIVYGSVALTWQADNGFPAFGLSLNNGGDTVFLYDVSDGDTMIVDEYSYQSFETADDRSTGRSTTNTDSWVIFDAMNPYSGTNPPPGTGCAPSPSLPNTCEAPVPTHETTWGAVKALYLD